MKGIILAGGNGTRLHPMTLATNKQMLPVYDKPMIYYPLSTLMMAGIKNILIISTLTAKPQFEQLLGDGTRLGLSISYAIQDEPNGLAEAFIIGEDFISGEPTALILGDNIFYGHGFGKVITEAAKLVSGARIFTNWVSDPERYGVAEFSPGGRIKNLVEKPQVPLSNWAVVGLYFFDGEVASVAKTVKPSARGELEIIDVIQNYLDRDELEVEKLGRGYAWLDTGTPQSLLQAATFVQTIEQRQGLSICCPEEIALAKGYIDISAFKKIAAAMAASDYGLYLARIVAEVDV